MKIQILFLLIVQYGLTASEPPSFDGVDEAETNYEQIADEYIRIALRLNEKGQYNSALELLRSGVTNTEFTSIKLRYFAAKQYVLVLQKDRLARQNQEFTKNLNSHYQAVKGFVQSSRATKDEIKYYTDGLRAMDKTGMLNNNPKLPANLSFDILQNKAHRARKRWPSAPGKCYPVVVLTAHHNGADGDGWSWPDTKKYRWRPISDIRKAIWDGTLQPGMVVYANVQPGADPSSLNMTYLPHWFTYLGKDENGIDRFGDQYSSNANLQAIENLIPGRVIDSFLDPYGRI